MVFKKIFTGNKGEIGEVVNAEEDFEEMEGEDSGEFTTTTTQPYHVDDDGEEIDDIEEEEESAMAKSSIKVANYDSYSKENLIEVITLVREGYTVFISFGQIMKKYNGMNLERIEAENKTKNEIAQFCTALLGAKLAIDATFDKLDDSIYSYIFAPNGVNVSKLKGETGAAKAEENEAE